MKLGLFGRPVSHSKSPVLFAALGRLLKKDISYRAVAVSGPLAPAVEKARAEGWKGANVTIPYKLEAAELAGGLTQAARRIGAVNVLLFARDVVGHNTDGDGLRDALGFHGVSLKGKRVLILGAGGAARAAGWACGMERAKSVRIVNRTPATASRLARVLGGYFSGTKFTAGAPSAADVWINATPSAAAPPDLPAPEAAVDLVYGKKTDFQSKAESLGAKTADGTAMLVFQALRAWEYWHRPLGDARRAELGETLIQEIS